MIKKVVIFGILLLNVITAISQGKVNVVGGEHGMLNIDENSSTNFKRNQNPDAQWFGNPENSFGLFVHWSICTVKKMNISWTMIAAKSWTSPLAKKHITDSLERKRIIETKDYDLTGKPSITPNEYWQQAKDFKPTNFSPDKWVKTAADAGMKYVVFTCRHHDGFALWPSKYGDFNTKNYLNGRDFVAEYVKACRKYNMKVGFYYSPPDWYFDREYKNFLDPTTSKMNPELPALDENLEPRKSRKTPAEIAAHELAYMAEIKGQVEELLTNYGKIDLLWFDGCPFPNAKNSITIERIRELQPSILVNPRLHGYGDFKTFERDLPMQKPDSTTWYEYCNPWCKSWSYMDEKPRHSSSVIGELVRCKALGIHYLLDVGPMANGDLQPDLYEGFDEVIKWMKLYGEAVNKVKPIPSNEKTSVLATASMDEKKRYLFLLTKFNEKGTKTESDILPATDEVLTIENVGQPQKVIFIKTKEALSFTYENNVLKVAVPKSMRSKQVDVVKVIL